MDEEGRHHHHPNRRKKFLLVLISARSLDADVSKNQQQALTVLEAYQVSHQVLDASDPQNKVTCRHLFAISGCSAFFPQFFLVGDDSDEDDAAPLVREDGGNRSGGGSGDEDHDDNDNDKKKKIDYKDKAVEFWGDFFQFQSLHEANGIVAEFGGMVPTTTKENATSEDEDATEKENTTRHHIVNCIGLIVYTFVVLSIPLLLMFGHEDDRPKLAAWIKQREHLVPSGWIEALGGYGDDEDMDDLYFDDTSMMGSTWNNPLDDKALFNDIFLDKRQKGKMVKASVERKDPFDWFRGNSKSTDKEHDHFFRRVAHFFKNKKDVATTTNTSKSDGGFKLEEMMTNFLAQVTESDIDSGPKESLQQMISLLFNSSAEVGRQLNQTLGHVGLERFNLLQFLYYMDHDESRKHSVWKRRMHRYQPQLQTEAAKQLFDGLYLSQLAYAPSCDEIHQRLQTFRGGLWALRNCTVEALVNQPAHFVVVRRLNPAQNAKDLLQQPQGRKDGGAASFGTSFQRRRDSWSWLAGPSIFVTSEPQQLEVAIVIRGSKEIFDFLTDGLLVAADYRDGKAHDGILRSALWLEQAYRADLKRFWQKSKKYVQGKPGKQQMKLWLIGHSLGGGAAALAAMQFRGNGNRAKTTANKWLDAEAVGFGTPSLLSPHLSYESKDYVTTVVNDADVVPRLSGAVMVKAWLNIVAFNWTDAALNDYDQLVELLEADDNLMSTFFGKEQNRKLFRESTGKIRTWLETWFDGNVAPWLEDLPLSLPSPQQQQGSEQGEVQLIPPGQCIHLYRDGVAYQGSYVNCSNFNELEIVRHAVDDHLIAEGYYKGILGFVRDQLKNVSWTFDCDLLEIDYP